MNPAISVVIPCFNEEDFIGACLDSLLASSLPTSDYELLVVDGRSEDKTREILAEYESHHDNIRMLDNPERTTPYALNQGIRAAQAPVILILGGHSEVGPDFLENNLKVLAEHPEVDCVGGRAENVYVNETARIIGAAMSSGFGVGDVRFRTGGEDGYVDTVAFGAYRQRVFDIIGYFDTELARNQDDEFNFRLTKEGMKIWYSDSIRYRYHVRASYSKLFRQYYQYGFWKVKVNRKHRTITTWRQVIPAFFVLYLILLLCAFLLSPWAAPGLIFLVLYIALGLFAAYRADSKHLFQVFYCFLILHISYGSGYLMGILSGGASGGQESTR